MKCCFNKKFLAVTLIAIAGGFFCSAQENEAIGVDRYALFVGSNMGGQNTQRLYYAESDAIAFLKTMKEIGGIPQSNAVLLLDPTKDDLNDAMDSVSELIRRNSRRSKRSEFLFYYSGHSDETALQLGNANYSFSELKAAITSVPSDVHVVILDSCYSGNFIRTKGGQKTKPFLLDDSSIVKGHAYLSSSSSQEYSQESDEIGSSFFTNAMLTGLRGAADSSGDKKVTLNELYSYAFNETLSKTENSSVGPQHPNYNITLVGSGDLVLSDISNSDSVVMLSEGLKGRVIIRDKNGKLVSEINKNSGKPVFLALEKGDYSATIIKDTVTLQGSFPVTSGRVYEISEKSFNVIATSAHRLRGGEGSEDAEKAENAIAEVSEEDPDIQFLPFEFSLVSNEISRQFGKKIVAIFSLGLIRSQIFKVNGLMLSGIENEAEYVNGAQLAGIFNTAGRVHGVQEAAIFNSSENEVYGVQEAGIFNKAKDLMGFQAAGIFNIAEDVRGVQVAGIFNIANDFTGAQVAGIFNKADTINSGCAQVAGIANCSKEVHDLQVAGICNVTEKLGKNNFQIGIVNIAKESAGFQIGLVNYSKTGIFEFGTSLNSNDQMSFTLNSGNQHFYCILGCWKPVHDLFTYKNSEDHITAYLYGFGTRFIKDSFNFDFEGWISNAFYRVDKDEDKEDDDHFDYHYKSDTLVTYRFVFGYQPVKHFRVFAAASAMCNFYNADEACSRMFKMVDINCGDRVHIYPQIEVGVKYSLND
ncbi:MAG: caspase family protein [Treponema sp.]|nr:caspase family protein [Treponema sp.]